MTLFMFLGLFSVKFAIGAFQDCKDLAVEIVGDCTPHCSQPSSICRVTTYTDESCQWAVFKSCAMNTDPETTTYEWKEYNCALQAGGNCLCERSGTVVNQGQYSGSRDDCS